MAQLTQAEFTAQVSDIQRQHEALDTADFSFCSYWPTAKTVLSLLQGLASGYPTVATAIKALIAAGDAVCSSSSEEGEARA